MDSVCRICMELTADLMLIANQTSDNEFQLLKPGTMFEDCFGIEVTEIPDYLKICMNCKIQLSYFYDFKQQALRTHQALLKIRQAIDPENNKSIDCQHFNDVDDPAKKNLENLKSGTDQQEDYDPYSQEKEEQCQQDNDEGSSNNGELSIEYLEDDIDFFNIPASPHSSKISVISEEQLRIQEIKLEVDLQDSTEQCDDCGDEDEDEDDDDFQYEYDVTDLPEDAKGLIVYEPIYTPRATSKKTARWKYKCEICGKNFRNMLIYTGHMNVHRGLPAYRCEICTKDFKFKVNYDYHMKNHNNNRSFKCSVCDKSCISKWDLKVHMRGHSDIRPYVCDLCGKSFRVRSHMTDHMETHNDQNTYECTICFQKYKTKATLKTHISTIHTKLQQFVCTTCDKIFYRKHHLKIHQKVHERNSKTD